MDVKELFDLTGKVAVVTGGAGGIGEVYAEALCGAGASVVIADVNVDTAAVTADALQGEQIALGNDPRQASVARDDDMADAAGLGARLIDIIYEARLSSAETKPSLIPFTAAWLESTDDEFTPKIRYT